MNPRARLDMIGSALFVLAILVLIWALYSYKMQHVPVRSQPAITTQSPQQIYNPELCKQAAPNTIYISLGRYIFPMAYSKGPNAVYDSLSAGNAHLALKVPDPTEQNGCFGNPLQSTSHAFFSPAILAAGDRVSSLRSAIRLLTLYRLNRGGNSREANGIWWGESTQLLLAESACKRATLREDLPNGMSACRIKPTNPANARQEDWAATYKARPDVYLTPMNRLFVVNCGPGLYSTGIGQCDVTYEIMPDLGVSYHLDPYPYPKKTSEPIDRVIEIDKSIRDAITQSIVKDYPWPDEQPNSARP